MGRTSETSPVCLVCLVHLVSLMQPNKPDRPNRPNRPNEQDRLADFFSILLASQENLRRLLQQLPYGLREEEAESHQRRGENNDRQMA